MKNECNIIRDILPLYIENMVSNDTVLFVEEHLQSCSECRDELENMKKSNNIESAFEINSSAVDSLKALKRKMRKRKMVTIAISFVTAATLVFAVLYFTIIYGFSASSENIQLESEFQYSGSAYLNQSFVLHISRMDGLPLNVSVKEIYGQDKYGKDTLIGYEITPREVLFNFGQHPGNYTIGYEYPEGAAPGKDFDFTITVKYTDKTVIYSMVKEGLFVPQDNVERYFE